MLRPEAPGHKPLASECRYRSQGVEMVPDSRSRTAGHREGQGSDPSASRASSSTVRWSLAESRPTTVLKTARRTK